MSGSARPAEVVSSGYPQRWPCGRDDPLCHDLPVQGEAPQFRRPAAAPPQRPPERAAP